jgi:hypothetical protein
LAISDIALLELTTLSTKERIRLNLSFESFLREIEAWFIVLPISGRICVRAHSDFPKTYPKDPAKGCQLGSRSRPYSRFPSHSPL